MISIYRNGGVYLIDEIDNGNANTLAGMNRIISQTKLDLANGECITKNKNFIIIATANTTGDGGDSKYRGRCAIDKATIDRFIMQEVKYDDALEIELANNKKDVVEFNKLVRK
jgi:MoxR-like ATPase